LTIASAWWYDLDGLMGGTSEQTNRYLTNSHTHVCSSDADAGGCGTWEIFNWVAGVTAYQARQLCYNASNGYSLVVVEE